MHLEQAPSIRENKTAHGTVAVVDMVGYSSLARMLEENMGAVAVADLNRQIQEFVRSALRHLEDPADCTKIAETGDGAILLFDTAHDAHLFAEQLHLNAAKHNRSRNEASAMRWFRVGIATGELNRERLLLEKDKYSGITIANAVRLETAADAGETVVDIETFGILPKEDRVSYGPETTVLGKRDERFTVRRYKVASPTHSPEPEVRHPRSKVIKLSAGAAAFAIALLTLLLEPPYVERLLHLVQSFLSPSETPVLSSLQAKPIVVHKGDTVTITIGINKPAPKDGVTVQLSSNDPSALPVDGTVAIYQGDTFATVKSTVREIPGYNLPLLIVATYNGATARTSVSVADQTDGGTTPKPPKQETTKTEIAEMRHPPLSYPLPPSRSVPIRVDPASPPKPAPINPELVSRLEEAQGRLSSEIAFWEQMKRQMPPGTSLRPEITSQIYAAKSASQRCDSDVKASDAASLGPCIDSLNDHLNQLKLQH